MESSLRSRRWLECGALLLGLCLSACQSGGGVLERFDTRSGLTIVTDPSVLAFARAEARYSRSARDYVYLGPVEINERGTRQYFLWVGFASTIDRRFLDAELAAPQVLYLVLEGAPVEFELEFLDELLPTIAGFKVYDPAVSPISARVARVTADQLVLLSGQELSSIRVASSDGSLREFRLWEANAPWAAFADYAR